VASHATVYDATFVALTEEPQCPFVTADARLAGKMGAGRAQLLSHQ
jgi:predicted nucleic acid-binding protein